MMMWQESAATKSVGAFGWGYNRANFKYDQGLRWQRFVAGRQMAVAQVGMFREDVADLAEVSVGRLRVYGPIYGLVVVACVVVLVEGRAGVNLPGPPAFVSGVYMQCLAIGMSFMALALWLLFHATLRAQVACVQLRTRMVRVPVPSQRQLDASRKFLSTWEEQGLYDMFRIPFVMPNGARSPKHSDEDEAEERAKGKSAKTGYGKGGVPLAMAKMKTKIHEAHKAASQRESRAPGFTPGYPSWYARELEERGSSSCCSKGAAPEGGGLEDEADAEEVLPAHFELMRAAQRGWWGCEAYTRVCYLYGVLHLLLALGYWAVLHCIGELGMIWCANLGAAGAAMAAWAVFRLDVMPDCAGGLPVELGGPFVASVALGLMYSQTATRAMLGLARALGALVILMQGALLLRLFVVAQPASARGQQHSQAKDPNGRLFGLHSGAADRPLWLPAAFQHVRYLVAPPPKAGDAAGADGKAGGQEQLVEVDMAPWRSVRLLLAAAAVGWLVQLAGHAVECVAGERMLTSNAGAPPWSRVGSWYGWEHGPTSSKQYAHVAPMRGHWAWQPGWGPNGQQEMWPSELFGFSGEADAWWAETVGPEPLAGDAGDGANTWAAQRLAFDQQEPTWEGRNASGAPRPRRLRGGAGVGRRPAARRPVPAPVEWPPLFEPDLLACGGDGQVAAFAAVGLGLVLPSESEGRAGAAAFELDGLADVGTARSVIWARDSLLVVTSSGAVAGCALPSAVNGSGAATAVRCAALGLPPLPAAAVGAAGPAPLLAAALETPRVGVLRVAVAGLPGRDVAIFEAEAALSPTASWRDVGTLRAPLGAAGARLVSLAAGQDRVVALTDDGTAYTWTLQDEWATLSAAVAVEAVAAGASSQRAWRSACALPTGRVVRLASRSRRQRRGGPSDGIGWTQELVF